MLIRPKRIKFFRPPNWITRVRYIVITNWVIIEDKKKCIFIATNRVHRLGDVLSGAQFFELLTGNE